MRPRSNSESDLSRLTPRAPKPELFVRQQEPVAVRQHEFQLDLRAYEPGTNNPIHPSRMRSESFDLSLTAFKDEQRVGRLKMSMHRNAGPIPPPDPGDIGVRVQGQRTAYISRIDNFTFDGFNKGVPGVGSTLMNQAEVLAQGMGATKISLHPAKTMFTRQVTREVPNTGFSSLLSKTRKVTETEVRNYDPTGFYEHVGYDRDPVQRRARHAEYMSFGLDPAGADQYARSRTALLSKPISQTTVTRRRAHSLPPVHRDG